VVLCRTRARQAKKRKRRPKKRTEVRTKRTMTGGMGMRDEEGTRPRRGGIGRRGKRIKKIRRSERNGKSGDNAVARALWNVIAAAGTLTGMTKGGTEAETGIGIGETGIVTGTGSGTTRGAPAVGAEAETKGGAGLHSFSKLSSYLA
jgi:hypothetical protein